MEFGPEEHSRALLSTPQLCIVQESGVTTQEQEEQEWQIKKSHRKTLCVLLGPTTLKREKIFIYFNITGTKQVKHLQCITDAQIYPG